MKPKLLLALFLAATGLAAASERPLVVDKSHSRVEIVVKATVDSFTGTLADYQPAIQVDPEANKVLGAKVGFHFMDVRTGKADRDEQMHDWQDTAKHPAGQFVLQSLQPGAEGRFTAIGSLTFHGMTREVVFPVTVTTDRHIYAIDGEAAIDTREFGLPVIRKFAVLKVDPIVHVRFHLQGAVAAN